MPGVTHVVYPYGPEGDPDDGVQYMRTLGPQVKSPQQAPQSHLMPHAWVQLPNMCMQQHE